MITERQLEVVLSVVYEYIKSGETVGSRTVSRRYLTGRSSATIRNEMSDLEDLGFLRQTHASSGRIPTTQGYRLYVNSVLQRVNSAGPSVKLLKKMMEHRQGLEKVLESASEMLSRVSDYVGIAAITPLDTVRFHHVSFVRMCERQVLLLVVLQGGLVHQKFIDMPVDMTQEDLDELASKLNRFSGRAWSEIKKTLKGKLLDEIGRYHEECSKAVLEIDAMLGAPQTKIFTGSFSHIMNLQDFQDLGRIKALCSFLEEEENMEKLVDRCSIDEMNIMIGDENELPGMERSALVAATGEAGGQKAVVGVIGPERMDYEKVITAIDGVLRKLDSESGERGEE
ncbi:MAG: heat-inducible transcriptional repressor HrcA [Synergistaceae bacterium]|nr:heat-inducible transcriptional repressor HrcA [Synergistaceae bacterium]